MRAYAQNATAAGLDPTARQAWQWLVTEVPQRSLHNWQNAAARLIAADLRGRVTVASDSRPTTGLSSEFVGMAIQVPPAQLVRAVEIARHHLTRLSRRMVPPQVAMIEMIMEAWTAQAIAAAANLGIADARAKGPLSADDLAAAVNADPAG